MAISYGTEFKQSTAFSHRNYILALVSEYFI